MGLLKNLGRIASAPVQMVDKVVVEPLADIAEIALEETGIKNSDDR